MKKINLKGITLENIIGVFVLILALTNSILGLFGIKSLPITNDDVNNVVSSIFVVITALYNTYKNRNISTASQVAQNITNAIKKGEVATEELEYIVKKLKNKS